MVDIQYSVAVAELLEYLKGIDDEDIEKIPKKLMDFWKEIASKDYVCNFDYNKPLKELQYQLSDDTLGLISMICYNYWCESESEKQEFLKQLEENEKNYQEKLKIKYDWKKDVVEKDYKINNNKKEDNQLIVKKEKFFIRIIKKIKQYFTFM